MKHILIDGTPISRHMDGLTQYILNVVLRLDVSAFRYTMLVRPDECPGDYLPQLLDKGIALEEVQISPIGPLRDLQFARYLRSHKHFDAAFIPSNQFPVALRLPAVYVIHDVIYEQFPEQLGRFSRLKRYYLRWVVRMGLRKARQVIAVSNYTKGEVVRCFGQQFERKIQVIYEGWEHLPLASNLSPLASNLSPFEEYILYVGSSRGHKNLARLVEAIQRCHSHLPKGWGFVIVGSTNMFTPEQREEIRQMNAATPIIHLTGWLGGEELDGYFRHAKAFIFPSLSEGFGIPVLEAYFYKIPLLLSCQASLPEVAGDAAIYFNPYDVNDIADTIVRFVNQNDHSDLIARQSQRLKLFSWQKAADQIVKIIQSI